MALENKREQHDQQVVDKYHDPITNYTMSTRDYVIRPKATQSSGPITITLPPVNEAKGRFYSIVIRAASETNTVTVTDQSDSECWTDLVYTESCQKSLFYSDGYCWHVLKLIVVEVGGGNGGEN